MELDELNVLIVDDEEQVRGLLKRFLSKAGHQISEAASVAEAADELDRTDFALALVDLSLGDGSGLELTKHILQEHPRTAVIMVTGMNDPAIAESALNIGAFGYLVKPFNSHAFAIQRHNALIRRRLEMENSDHVGMLESRVRERTEELQNAYERLEKSQHARDEFLSMASHELRTPLTPILGWARVLTDRRTLTEEQAQAGADSILLNTRRLTFLVESILKVVDFRTDPKLPTEQPRPDSLLDIPVLIEDAIGRADVWMRQVDVDIASLDGEIRGDPDEILTVLSSLLENAAKFTPDDSPLLITARMVGTELRLEVSDRGPGVSDEDKSRIFDYLVQGDSSSTREQGGLGIGLYISRYLIEGWGGRLWVEDGAAGGATFLFTLPQPARSQKVSVPA